MGLLLLRPIIIGLWLIIIIPFLFLLVLVGVPDGHMGVDGYLVDIGVMELIGVLLAVFQLILKAELLLAVMGEHLLLIVLRSIFLVCLLLLQIIIVSLRLGLSLMMLLRLSLRL